MGTRYQFDDSFIDTSSRSRSKSTNSHRFDFQNNQMWNFGNEQKQNGNGSGYIDDDLVSSPSGIKFSFGANQANDSPQPMMSPIPFSKHIGQHDDGGGNNDKWSR